MPLSSCRLSRIQVFVDGHNCKKVKKTRCQPVQKKRPYQEPLQKCRDVPYQVREPGCTRLSDAPSFFLIVFAFFIVRIYYIY